MLGKALLIALLSTVSTAALQTQEQKCDGDTVQMFDCEYTKYKALDQELNIVYQKAIKSVQRYTLGYTPEDLQKLRTAERKWIAYRDAVCEAEYSLWGLGSGGPTARTVCLARVTKVRIADLRAAYD